MLLDKGLPALVGIIALIGMYRLLRGLLYSFSYEGHLREIGVRASYNPDVKGIKNWIVTAKSKLDSQK